MRKVETATAADRAVDVTDSEEVMRETDRERGVQYIVIDHAVGCFVDDVLDVDVMQLEVVTQLLSDS